MKLFMAWPSARMSVLPKPRSARTEPSIAEATSWIRIGFRSTPLLVALWMSEARNRCWRCMRPRSEAPSRWRERTYWRAWPPFRFDVPTGRSRPVYLSFSGRTVQTWTPPSTSTVFMKLVKSTSR